MKAFIHPNGICESDAIGEGTRVWAFAHILPGAQIGRECNICDHVFIENDVIIGDRTTVKCGVQLWDGLRVGDDVFLGPNASFTNDKFPRSKSHQAIIPQTVIENGASVGANSTILPGIRIGRRAMIGAGAVVTHDVPPGAIVFGNPARITGYVDSEKQALRPLQTISTTALEPAGKTPIIGSSFLVVLPTFRDARGALAVADYESHLPFQPRRTFFVYDVPSKNVRGEHAHHDCEQFLICVQGTVSVVLDDGTQRKEVLLDGPHLGLYVPTYLWTTQYRFNHNSVLAVFASHAYDSADYIRDYDEYLEVVKQREAI